MKGLAGDRVVPLLREPGSATAMSLGDWDVVVRQARTAGLLARIAESVREHGQTCSVPAAPAGHLEAEIALARAQHNEVWREAVLIMRGLQSSGVKVVFLKGAGYLLGRVPAAKGRLFSDIDILVPKGDLPVVETRLMVAGWAMTHHAAYDQRYYRDWMHELPPMQHSRRGTVLDIHHSILPQTARRTADASKLLADAVPVEGLPGAFVLAPADMVLHSMTHLFFNEEFSHGLRDLSDIDILLRHFGRERDFWDRLAARATALGLGRPLFYGLRHVTRTFGVAVPPTKLPAASNMGPPIMLGPLMDTLWIRALRTPHPTAEYRGTRLALLLLYLRAHWFRMPMPMLVRHLAYKLWRRSREKDDVTAGAG